MNANLALYVHRTGKIACPIKRLISISAEYCKLISQSYFVVVYIQRIFWCKTVEVICHTLIMKYREAPC